MLDRNQNLALEEWKLCQSVISQLEDAIYRRQGWFFALITALVVSLLQKDPLLTGAQFTVLAIGIVLVFFVVEVIQRVPHHRAIRRSRRIEAYLRGDLEHNRYDGPVLSLSLGEGYGWRDDFAFFRRIRIWAPYAAMIIVILVVWYFAPPSHASIPPAAPLPA